MTFRSDILDELLGGQRSATLFAFALACVSAILLLTGCDILSVQTPDIVRPESLESEAGLQARRNGAFGDFKQAFTGGESIPTHDGLIQTTGAMSDELKTSATNFSRVQVDARRVDDQNEAPVLLYADLHRARQAAEKTAEAYLNFENAPNSDTRVSEMMSLAGFTYTFFGEAFCSGVPFSQVENGSITYGEPKTTEEIFQLSAERFSEGISRGASAGSDLEFLARIGRARALLNLGQFAQSAETVQPVPTDFLYNIQYASSSPRQVNTLYETINVAERMSVVTKEGGNGVDYFGAFDAGDPRTPYVKEGEGFDSSVEMFKQLKYSGRSSPIPLATGIEARLIEAEAALQEMNRDKFASIHNNLRARIELAPIDASTMSQEEMTDFHFRERALWLWLTGHRMGDMRRLIRQYGRDSEDVFPSGPYFKSQFVNYGEAVTLPIPRTELNNPNFNGCLSRDA